MFSGASDEQVHAILAAAHRVTQAVRNPADPRSGRGDGIVVAAGRILFTPSVTVDPASLPRIEPQDLARAVGPDRNLADHAAALIACASLADGEIDPTRLRLVVEYAHAMHVREGWVRNVLEVARGHVKWAMADFTRRNASNFPGFANADDTLAPMMPYEAQTDDDKRLAERFLVLEGLPKKYLRPPVLGTFPQARLRLPRRALGVHRGLGGAPRRPARALRIQHVHSG
jgi:hypothetical protein